MRGTGQRVRAGRESQEASRDRLPLSLLTALFFRPQRTIGSCALLLLSFALRVCMCVRVSVCLYQKTVFYYIHTRGGEAGQAQERQHPEKSSTFLSFLCSPAMERQAQPRERTSKGKLRKTV